MLLGNYPYDDEGVTAQNVQLVDHGVLKTFLMGRSPLVSIPNSNGHGRRQLGYVPVARQGNLIVSSSKTMTNDQLRQKLIELVKEQGKPFGLLIDDIAGGFTFTGRGNPQAFQVLPLVVYKVFPDGRPDELGARRGYRGNAARFADEDCRHRRHARYFQRLLRSRIGLGARLRGGARDTDFRDGSAEKGNLHRPAADPAAPRTRFRDEGTRSVKKITVVPLLMLVSFGMPLAAAQPRPKTPAPQAAPIPAGDNDKTLQAMRDELERSRTRLQLPGVEKPFYIEYRLLDVDVRSVTASFGALLASDNERSRFMSVDVRVGDYHLDSSNFISEDGFRGFLGSTGQVGIDRDYNSLRQDFWLATDQAYKAAVTQMSLKNAFLRSLTKPPEIDDFSEATPHREGRSARRSGLDLAQLG